MPESQCIKLPPALSFNEAASMALVYDTAYFALKDRGRIATGETVLVLGATGGVGLAAIQFAKAMGGKVIAAVGNGVTKFKVGDHALLMAESAGFAEFAVMPEGQCIKLPPALAFEEAASMALVYDTAYFALKDRGRIAPGETVLVLGATGGVGLAAIQLAKAFGSKVFAAVASKDKEDIVRAAGADAIVDLSAPDLHESLRAQVFALTGKKGVDIIVDMLGGDIFDAAVRALAWCGRLIVIGFASGRIPSLKMNYVLVKNIEVSGMQISDYRKRRPADMQAAFAEIYAMHAAGKLKPLPTKTYPLEQFAQALTDIKDRKVRGRIVLTMKR